MVKSWYVIQTVGGMEDKVMQLIDQLILKDSHSSLVHEMFVPRYHIKKRYHGMWITREEILLPGYVFVITPDPKTLQEALYRIPAFARVLRSSESFTRLDSSEIQFINAFTAPGHRIIEMSEGIIEGDTITILNGPLMGQIGLIKRIDRHKRLAYLEVDIMQRPVTVKVGLEIVQKS